MNEQTSTLVFEKRKGNKKVTIGEDKDEDIVDRFSIELYFCSSLC